MCVQYISLSQLSALDGTNTVNFKIPVYGVILWVELHQLPRARSYWTK